MNKVWWLVSVCLFVLFPLAVEASAQTSVGKSDKAFARGVTLQQQGNFAAARDAYETALRTAPNRIDALGNLGQVYLHLGDAGRAVEYFERVVKLKPNLTSVRLYLGMAEYQAGNYEDALNQFQTLLGLDPSNSQVRQLLSLCLLKLGRIEEGIRTLEPVAQTNPKDLSVTYTLTSAYIAAGQLDKAKPLVERLAPLDSAESHMLKGAYLLGMLRYRDALPEFQNALSSNPRLPGLHAQLGYTYLFEGKRDLAEQMFQEELKIDPTDSNALGLLGCLYRQNGRLADASVLLAKAAKLRANDPDLFLQMALLAKSEGEYGKAIEIAERAVGQEPDFTPGHILLAELYFKTKQLELAEKEKKIIDHLNSEGKNQPTVRERALYEVMSNPSE